MAKNAGPALPSLDDAYSFDEAKAQDGVWINLGQFGFKMRHVDLTDSRYHRIKERVTRPWRQQIERETLDSAKDKRLSVSIFVEAFLLGWRTNELDDDGKLVGVASDTVKIKGHDEPFSKDKAIDVLCALPKLFQQLANEGATLRHYRYDAEAEAADLGN